MTYDDNNIFAKILRGEIPCKKIYEDEYVLSASNLLVYEPSTGEDFLSLASFIKFSNVLSILNSNRNSF